MEHGGPVHFHAQKVIRLAICCLFLVSSAKAGHHHAPSPSPTPVPKVTLAWNVNAPTGNTATDAVGYHLKLGFASGQENTVIDVPGQQSSAWTVSLQSGTTYFLVLTAYNAAGVESVPSNEVSYTSPP
jgi:hypothetical protein